jgi:FAD/FMN-containing dehydrogenase/Fe-S oxidoreductase
MSWTKYDIEHLKIHFEGELFLNDSFETSIQKRIYSTDASVYQVQPTGVVKPTNPKDLKRIIQFANKTKSKLIPRGAGTSLAGQVVGKDIIVEISKGFNRILQTHKKEKSTWVEPGIIRDDLNSQLRETGLFFGPETSTSNRALIGGMIGNNSCGLHSIVWGNTRDHVLELKAFLSDGTEIHTHDLSVEEFYAKTQLNNLEGKIYKELHRILNNHEIQELIREKFPKKSVKRRNTGYALDALIEMKPFHPNGKNFNLSALLTGSEGTLALVHAAKLQLLELPPEEVRLLCVHCTSIHEAMLANIEVLKFNPLASELVDDFILSFTKGHPQFEQNRDFISGDPQAILMVEFRHNSINDLDETILKVIQQLSNSNLGYAYPILKNEEIYKGWDIRKAGLGLIRNLIADEQAVNLIEDCAVDPIDLPNYVDDIQNLLKKHQVKAAFYAHAGAGELHIEPFINLKTKKGRIQFRSILEETVTILKKYKGALSGEHGDGRLRGEFIPKLMGNEIYELFKEVKNLFDPNHILNPGKIVDTPPMDEDFRMQIDQKHTFEQLFFDYGSIKTPLILAEKCSGSGDCKKSHLSGGTLCPSYMATLNEKNSTRARANILRQILSDSNSQGFESKELNEVLDLCLSCKACKTECPSGVDITQLKAEVLAQQYEKNGIPFKNKIIGHFPLIQKYFRPIAPIYNFINSFPLSAGIVKSIVGFAKDRSLPKLHFNTLEKWFDKYSNINKQDQYKNGKVILIADEFTNYNDVKIGQKAIQLLNKLGYSIIIPNNIITGRSYLSKGMVKTAKALMENNLEILSRYSSDLPIIGIEPSAIITFVDEGPKIVSKELQDNSLAIKNRIRLIDDFIADEFKKGNIQNSQFKSEKRKIVLHGHCHQKAVLGLSKTRIALEIPTNYTTELIPSGCCGMAGSFGYEKKKFKLSQRIAELVLYPKLRTVNDKEHIIAMNGTSCRHQIKDGLEKTGKHTVEILFEALNEK